jgi:hypothetical protein
MATDCRRVAGITSPAKLYNLQLDARAGPGRTDSKDAAMTLSLDIRRASERFRTRIG